MGIVKKIIRALKYKKQTFSLLNKTYILHCMVKIYYAEFQRVRLKSQTIYLNHIEFLYLTICYYYHHFYCTTLTFYELLDFKAHSLFWNASSTGSCCFRHLPSTLCPMKYAYFVFSLFIGGYVMRSIHPYPWGLLHLCRRGSSRDIAVVSVWLSYGMRGKRPVPDHNHAQQSKRILLMMYVWLYH